MDQVLSVLASFPPDQSDISSSKRYDVAIRNHIAALSKVSDAMRTAVLTDMEGVFQNIDPASNSIGYLAAIDTILHHPETEAAIDRIKFLDKVLEFLMKFDPYQIRYVGRHLIALLDAVAAGKLFPVTVAVEVLATAILRVDSTGSVFTSTHLSLAKLAVETRTYEPALRVTNKDITLYPNMGGAKESKPMCDPSLSPAVYISSGTSLTHPLKSTSVLEYNLLCGMVHISRRDWRKAKRSLERVISHPTKDKGVSMMMSESYKKWVLVGLLSDGHAPSLPPNTSSATKNSYNTLATPYNNVAKLFSTDNATELRTEIEANQKTWDEDSNLSLMTEVIGAYQEWQIMNLRRIYHQVSLSQVRQATLSAHTGQNLKDDGEVTALLQKMIGSGMLKGEIDASGEGETYLKFLDDYTAMTESDFAREIAQSHAAIQELSKQYQLTNERLSGNKDYIKHVVREQKRADKDLTDPAVGFDTSVEDEDLMTGIVSNA